MEIFRSATKCQMKTSVPKAKTDQFGNTSNQDLLVKRRQVGSLIVVCISLTVILLVTLTPFPSSLKVGPLVLSHYTFWVGWGSSSGADVLENIFLFVPLGASAAAFLEQWAAQEPKYPSLATVGFCLALSYGIEVLQTVMPSRFPSLFDVIANTTGGWIGCQFFCLWMSS